MQSGAKTDRNVSLKFQDEQNSQIQNAISQTFKSTAHLANHLPTGTVLAFQFLSPIFTNQGSCSDVSRAMTSCLVALCGLSCLILSFSDSFRDDNGTIRHGLATVKGLWVIDGTLPLPTEVAVKYRIRFIDFIHAFMSILVFAAIALLDQNVVSCFYPIPTQGGKQILTLLPVAIGAICSMMFVTFPHNPPWDRLSTFTPLTLSMVDLCPLFHRTTNVKALEDIRKYSICLCTTNLA